MIFSDSFITGEIVTCYGLDAKIKLPVPQQKLIDPDETIRAPETVPERARNIIGSSDVGCLFNERKFVYGFLPWGNVQRSELGQYVGLQGSLSYYDFGNKVKVDVPFTILDQRGSPIHDEICENYFISS